MNEAASRAHRLAPLLAAWVALLALATLCQVALKLAGNATGAFVPDRASVIAALSTPWLWVAIACYIGEFLVWMSILEKSALSAAFPTSAITYVTVMAASWAVLGEAMDWEKITGSAIIVIGILLLGSEQVSHPPRGDGRGADGRTL